ncbi:putative lipoyl synthase [Candidatus Zinderia insecticola CARI]|uniref:lipoyl synthase n=1 Tax=Zinderia insecticola (strain CARI) TaxID=871271 RepID=E0TIL2_ZINIC|nr:putative lipoyl synthase [Candidatus Zinderia insecticola CARI]
MKILKKPKWIYIKFYLYNNKFNIINKILNKNSINTICKESLCPNIFKCFQKKNITFLLLGNKCTRKCLFCNISKGKLEKNNLKKEVINISKIIFILNLNRIILTSVNRDDLPDKGIMNFIKIIKFIKIINFNIKIEILIPNFNELNNFFIKKIKINKPYIISHNIETIYRLYNKICKNSNYFNSINFLKKIKLTNKNILLKTGIIIGLGETFIEIFNLIRKLKKININIINIGQYLSPNINNNYLVYEYLKLYIYYIYKKFSKKLNFKKYYIFPMSRTSL